MLNYEVVKNWRFAEATASYDASSCILYALSLGVGVDAAADRRYLDYVYEEHLRALPTMAVTLGFPGSWMRDPRTGIDFTRLVHGEQRLKLHAALPAAATLAIENKVTDVVDKGLGKGALVIIERTLREAGSGTLLATLQQVSFCRGDGGFSAGAQLPDRLPAALPPVPQRSPDAVHTSRTAADMALLYRLCGDRNPLHADPETAAAAGFPRPILHGLATFGLAGKALVATVAGLDESRIAEISARFSAPMFPGETVETQIWSTGLDVHFRCRAVERTQVVLDYGLARLRE